MAISDYLLTLLRGRQGLAENEYKRQQLALQQEQAKAAREAQQQRAYLSALGQLGDVAVKGIGMGAGMLEQQVAKEAAGRLTEAQARAELQGLEEFTPEEIEVLDITEGAVPPTTPIREQLSSLIEQVPAKTPEVGMVPKEIPAEISPLQARLAEGKALLKEQPKRAAARKAIEGMGLLGVEDLTSPEQESMEFTLEDLKEPVEKLPEMEVELPKEEPKAEEPSEQAPPEEAPVERALSQAEKITGMKIRRFKKSPNEIAEEIVNQVYTQKPSGNPLLRFFSGDPAKIEREKLIAKAAVAKEISNTRKQLVEQDFDRFMKEKGMQLREDQVEVSRLAKEAALKRAEGTIRLKTNLPSADRKVLFGYKQAQDQLGRTVKYAKKLLDNGEGFPIGKVRAAIQAYINENAGVEGSIATGLGAGAGIPVGGLNVNINQARTKQIDADLLNDAFKALDKTNLSTNQRQFLQNLNIAIQNIGKSMEGGKLTDKDLLFYLDNLISSDDPQSALISINDLMERNFDEFNALRENLAGSYELSALAGFEPIEPTLFTQEEIESAFEAGVGPAAAAMGQRAQMGLGAPQTQLSAGVSQALNKISEALRTEKDPERQKILKQQARQKILMQHARQLMRQFPGEAIGQSQSTIKKKPTDPEPFGGF